MSPDVLVCDNGVQRFLRSVSIGGRLNPSPARTPFQSHLWLFLGRLRKSLKIPYMEAIVSLMSALEEQVLKLTKLQKIGLMEAIWADLTRDEHRLDVPDWHVKELEATERRISEGEAFFEDWTEVKRRLREQ